MLEGGKKSASYRGQPWSEKAIRQSLGAPEINDKINELRELSKRWAEIKAGDPERFNLYHGCEARGI